MERLENRLKWLEQDTRVTKTKLERVEELARNYAPTLFLFAGFCALWAQNTRRNAVLWFFLGLIFNFVAVLVVLAKNGPEAANR